MRWRYLILGLFVAVPAATLIHVWPQRPAYCIEGGRQYLADDPAQRQLLFLRDDRKAGLPPVIERYNADSGRLESQIQLRLTPPDPKLAMEDRAMISSDLTTISVFDWIMDENSQIIGMRVFIFDAATGNRRPGELAYYVQFDWKGFSPNGRWLAMIHSRGQMVVIDTQAGRTHFMDEASSNGKYVSTGIYFSPDGRHLLYQWQIDGQAASTMHLVNLETGLEVATFSLPAGRTLCEWRPNELRSYESLPRTQSGWPVRRYRHAFDGKTLGPAVLDSLLDCDFMVLASPNGTSDTDSWIGQFEMYPPRQPEWVKLLDKIEPAIGMTLIDRGIVPYLAGCVRIIDRATKAVRFEKDVPCVHQCRLALDSKLLIVDTKPVIADMLGIGLGTTAPTSPPPPPAPFEIYRTDGWPRWIWTALGAFVILAAFALMGRWRHVVIRRRWAAPRSEAL